MITAGFLMKKFLIRGEITLALVTISLVVYVIYLTGNFSGHKLDMLLIDAAIATVLSSLVHTVFRRRKLTLIVNQFNAPEADLGLLKGKILDYPKFDGIMIIFRWVAGPLVVIGLLYLQVDLDAMNVIPFLLLIPIIIPITCFMVVLIGENILSVLLNDERIRNAAPRKDSYRPFNLIKRMMYMAFSIIIIPLGILGFFLYLSNSGQLKLENFGLHILFVTFLSIATIALCIFEMTVNTRASIHAVTSAIESIMEGDLSISAIPMLTSSEIGMISQHINALVKRLRDIITSVKQTSDVVNASSKNITDTSQTVSTSASEQASGIEEISSTIEEMLATVTQTAENSIVADSLSELSFNLADKGSRIVNTAVESINEINISSKKIADIITLINDIAFQTNLLALNAAVEAARAGDQGRGFAVVAGEVRNLAQRSRSASDEISLLITSSVEKVDAGTKLANESGTALKEIFGAISKVHQIVAEIKASSQEQKAGLGQITSAINQADTVTQQNAAAAEELATTAESLRDNVVDLQQLVSFFKV